MRTRRRSQSPHWRRSSNTANAMAGSASSWSMPAGVCYCRAQASHRPKTRPPQSVGCNREVWWRCRKWQTRCRLQNASRRPTWATPSSNSWTPLCLSPDLPRVVARDPTPARRIKRQRGLQRINRMHQRFFGISTKHNGFGHIRERDQHGAVVGGLRHGIVKHGVSPFQTELAFDGLDAYLRQSRRALGR